MDEYPEAAFNLVGTIEDAIENALSTDLNGMSGYSSFNDFG